MQKFTSDDLFLYTLNELDNSTRNSIEKAMLTNPQIKKEIEEFQISLQDISNFNLEPNPKSMDYILNELNQNSKIQIV